MKTRRERPIQKFPQILVGFLLLLYLLFWLWRVWASVTNPYPIEYGEGAVFYEANQLAHNHPLYTANIAPPYQAVVYGPLYYYLNAIPLALTSNSSFAFGRLLAVMAAVVAAACVFFVMIHDTGRWMALAAAFTPFATEPVFAWGTLFKPDMLATALSLGAVTLAWRIFRGKPDTGWIAQAPSYPLETNPALQNLLRPTIMRPYQSDQKIIWLLTLCAVLCVVALFIKQSAFAAPLAIFLSLLNYSIKLALRFALIVVGVTLLLGILFQVVTNSEFLTHFITYNNQPFEFSWLITALTYVALTYLVLLLLSIIWIIQTREIGIIRLGWWEIYWIISLLVTFSVGKVGSNLNYYLELMFISAMLSWRLLYKWWYRRPKLEVGKLKLPLATTGFLLMALQLILLHHIPVIADGANTPGPGRTAQEQQIALTLQQYASNGPLVVEDAGWLSPLHLTTDLDDSFVFGQLAQSGQWQQARFLQDLASGHYRTVMLQMYGVDNLDEAKLDNLVAHNQYQTFPNRFSPQMLDLFSSHFRPAKRIGTTLFLTWKL